MPLAYLFSRYPVVSQTFCDSEMLALEARGRRLVIASLNPPTTSFRHERLRELRAEVIYPPPAAAVKLTTIPPAMMALVADHDVRYGAGFKAATRARNAAWLAPMLAGRGVRHIHVHFANRATHTALFLKKAGFTFSFTAHAQDYMVDLGSDELLRELAREAEFVIAVSHFSRDDLRRRCPERVAAIHRVYNGLNPDDFPLARLRLEAPLRVLSIGRLIEFKGFHHLVEAMGKLRDSGVAASLEIIGEGPWRGHLERQIEDLNLQSQVRLEGVLSLDAIKQRLACSDVFALASCVDSKGASDILPTVIMEAMAARLPVVSTLVAGVPEMVEHNVTGLLVPAKDPSALAGALARLAADPSERDRLAQAGRRRCQELFSLAATSRELLGHLDAVPSAHPKGQSPAHAPEPRSSLLVLSSAGAEPEWDTLLSAPREPAFAIAVLAAGWQEGRPAPWQEFLPDAIVLEAAWCAHPEDAAQCEALYATLDGVDGETFFRDARRALWTAELVRKRSICRLHAARADTMLWTWLVHRLTGTPATATVENDPPLPRSILFRLLDDFQGAIVGDPKIRASRPHASPDCLGLGPVEKKRWFRAPAKPTPDIESFHHFLTQEFKKPDSPRDDSPGTPG